MASYKTNITFADSSSLKSFCLLFSFQLPVHLSLSTFDCCQISESRLHPVDSPASLHWTTSPTFALFLDPLSLASTLTAFWPPLSLLLHSHHSNPQASSPEQHPRA